MRSVRCLYRCRPPGLSSGGRRILGQLSSQKLNTLRARVSYTGQALCQKCAQKIPQLLADFAQRSPTRFDCTVVAPGLHNFLIWKAQQKIGNLMASLVVLSGSLGNLLQRPLPDPKQPLTKS